MADGPLEEARVKAGQNTCQGVVVDFMGLNKMRSLGAETQSKLRLQW